MNRPWARTCLDSPNLLLLGIPCGKRGECEEEASGRPESQLRMPKCFPQRCAGTGSFPRLEVTGTFPAIVLPPPSLALGRRTLNPKAKCSKNKEKKGGGGQVQHTDL